jgi:hypothetical protein
MPRGNGTGPMGMGPMSGRGAGYCAGYAMPGQMNPFGGRGGFGYGRGGGFGRGFAFGRGRYGAGAAFTALPYGANQQAAWGAVTAEQEQAALKSQLANLDKLSNDLRQRLSDLESAETNKQ